MNSIVKIEGYRNRRDKSWVWELKNPILDEGEIGVAEDLGYFKLGNGVTRWNDLPYFKPQISDETMIALSEHLNSATPHSVYDNGPSLVLLYENKKV